MKKKIKLRDVTPEQYREQIRSICRKHLNCDSCIFGNVKCVSLDSGWVYHKDLYSDKFLDQEIEIEVPTFTDKEREYLHNLLKPFKDRITTMQLVSEICNNDFSYLQISIKSVISHYDTENIEFINLPYFETGTMYKNLEVNKPYTDDELKELLKELELL